MPTRPSHQAPPRLWAPARFRALVSAVATLAAGLAPAAVVLLPASPAYADPGDIIIEADIEDVEAGTFTFEIRRVGPTTTPFTLTYETAAIPGAAHPATAGVDFTAVSGSTTFSTSTRDSIKRITVTGIADSNDENDEVFGLSLTNVTDPLNNLALGTLSDDDAPPTYSFDATETVGEDAGTVTATATLSAASDFPVTIPYTTTAGTATAGEDYTTSAGDLYFAPGDATEDVTVAILDDTRHENAESFTIDTTGTPTNATLTTASKTVDITDDDATPTVSIGSAGSVREGDPLGFPVTLSTASGLPVQVTANAAGGTATSVTDHEAVSSETVTVPAGQTSVNLPVDTVSDPDTEDPPETVQVTISNPVGATLGTATATGTIVDSDVEVTPSTAIAEGDSGTHDQVFDVTLSAAPASTVEIDYVVAAGTATAGTDFDSSSGTLTFAAGETTQQITVPVHGDAVYEPAETFTITLANTDGLVTGGLGASPFTIPNDDASPTVASMSSVSVAEGSGSRTETFTATLSGVSSEDVTLDVTAADVTAVAAVTSHGSDDYDLVDTTVTVPAGSLTADIEVQVNGDAIYEADETATVTATVAGGETGATPGSTQSGTLTLTNDDALPVVTVTSDSGAEGTAAHPVAATVTGTAQAAINYTVAATDGTAEAADYDDTDLESSGTITPGLTSLDLGTVALLDDTVDDAADALDITVTPTGLTAATGSVTITDALADAPPKIVGTAAVGPVVEDSGPVVVPVTLSYDDTAAATTENVITVGYSMTAGTAKASLDYTATPGTLTFTPGQAAPVLSVPLTDDAYFEVDEIFTVTLAGASGAGALETDATTVTVSDDDGPAPSFTVAQNAAVTEGGQATFTVTLAGPAAVDTTFDVTHTAGTAVGSDYSAPAATVTILKDETTATFTVQTTADTVYEGTETATVTVERAMGVTSAASGAVNGTLTVTDDDPIPTLVLNTVDTGEGGSFDVTATRTGVAEDDMAYTVTVAGDGADPAEVGDFSGSGATVTIPGGTSAATETILQAVTLNGDTIDENTETLRATVHNDTVSTPDVSSTYGITDAATNQSPEIVYGSPVTVAENAGPAVVPVSLSWAGLTGNDAASTEKTITAQYTTVDGTAAQPGDFTAVSGTLTFVAGDTGEDVSVALADDAVYELSEQFTVRLSAPSGATVPVADATVTVTDEDTAGRPSFSVDPVTGTTVAEGDTAAYTVELSAAALTDTTFDVTLTGGTATGADYTAPSATVTIGAGDTSATVEVPIVDDSVYEGSETRTLGVALAGGESDVTGSAQSRTITISDDEAVPTITLAADSDAEGQSVAVAATPSGVAEQDMTYTLSVAGDATGGADAAENTDYSHGLTTVTIPGGSTAGVPVAFGSITLANDTVDEETETIAVTAHNDTYATSDVSQQYTITDDPADTAPVVTIASPVTLGEAAGPAVVPVTLDFTGSSAATTEKVVTVGYTTTAGTATAGGDFTTASGTLSFTPGNNTANISVPVAADGLFETDEQFTVDLSGPANATLGTASNTVTITDDDSGAIPGFTVSSDVTVTEGGSAQFTVTLDSAAAGVIDFDATVTDVTTTDGGTASLGTDDYTVPAVDFTIAKDATTATVTVPITDDTAYEGVESFTLQIGRDVGETLATGTAVTRTVTVTDNDAVPTLTMVAAEAAEAASVAVTATTSGLAERDMIYSLTLAGDATGGRNAAEASDFTDSAATATVTGGTASGSTVSLRSVPLLSDTVDEPDETIKVTAHNDTYTTADVTGLYRITDDPGDRPPMVSLGSVTVAEGAGTAAVPVTLSFLTGNDATSSEQAISIAHQVIAGTAEADDYGSPASPRVIAAGATSGTIPVPIIDDVRYEPEEAFTVRATAVSPSGAVIGAANSGTVTITDNDQNVERPTFTVSSASVDETAGVGTFTVTLSAAAPYDVDFTVGVQDGTASEGGTGVGSDDYDPPAGALRIPQGSRTATFTVPVNPDSVFEHDETARVTVALAAGETDAVGAAAGTTLTILNDDARPVLTLAAPDPAAEGATVALTAVVDGVTQPVVNYGGLDVLSEIPGDLAEPSDFEILGEDVVVPAGTTTGARIEVARILLNEDTVDENTETLGVSIGGGTAAVLITDDDADLAPTVSTGDATVGEGEKSVSLNVGLDFPGDTTGTERTVSVPWSTVPGTAEAGRDFTAGAGTARFAPGIEAVVVTVPILEDAVKEDDQDFIVRLGTPEPGDVQVEKSESTVTIEDDDTTVRPTLTVASAVVTGAQRVRLRGTAAPGAEVELLTAAGATGSGGYRVVLTTEAGDDGTFSFNPNFTQGYRLYARSGGLVSPVRTVQVRQDPEISLTATTAGTVRVTVTGDPARPGPKATVQRLVSGRWTAVASGNLGVSGTFTATVRGLRSDRNHRFRAVIAAAPALGTLAGTSPARTIRAR
jgi:hypothetical protein